ncbi:MAG: DUF5320 domain-containing protein [Firmicutes bacterium]|nr:DUF5320 domain-containing protein [Bacillota bacterium]
MYGGRYGYGPGFRRRGRRRYPGAHGFWGRGPGPGWGWGRYWYGRGAPYYEPPPWAAPYGPGIAGPEVDESQWLKAEAASLRAEAEAITNELAEIERRLAEIERPEET